LEAMMGNAFVVACSSGLRANSNRGKKKIRIRNLTRVLQILFFSRFSRKMCMINLIYRSSGKRKKGGAKTALERDDRLATGA